MEAHKPRVASACSGGASASHGMQACSCFSLVSWLSWDCPLASPEATKLLVFPWKGLGSGKCCVLGP